MKAITFEAPQSRNLTLEQTSFKSAFKSQARRQWLRINLALRNWSRSIVTNHERALITAAATSILAGFFVAGMGKNILVGVCALIAMAALAPEMIMMSYEPLEQEHSQQKGGAR